MWLRGYLAEHRPVLSTVVIADTLAAGLSSARCGRRPPRLAPGERSSPSLGGVNDPSHRRGADDRRGHVIKEFCPHGRDAQSIAFFNAPGIDRLNSGVTNKTASTAAIASFSTRPSGG